MPMTQITKNNHHIRHNNIEDIDNRGQIVMYRHIMVILFRGKEY